MKKVYFDPNHIENWAKRLRFDPHDFPHIDMKNAVIMQNSHRLWPLCNLGQVGCQSVAIIPPELHKLDEEYYWEWIPKIKSCENCKFHKNECYQKHNYGTERV